MPIILTNTDPEADYIALVEKTKKTLASNGIEVQRTVESQDDGSIHITMKAVHLPSGQYMKSELSLHGEKYKILHTNSPRVFLHSRIMYEGLIGVACKNDALEAEAYGPTKVIGKNKIKQKSFSDQSALALTVARKEGLLSVFRKKEIPFLPEKDREAILSLLENGLQSYTDKTAEYTRLSWSDIKMFMRCQRCFYITKKFNIRFNAFDVMNYGLEKETETLLKAEFDEYRRNGKQHPVMAKIGICKPLKHKKLDKWRTAFSYENKHSELGGIQYHDAWDNCLVYGGVDDVWINDNQELIIVDYKSSTTRTRKIYQEYQKQVEFYAWLFEMNNYKVAPIGYLLVYRPIVGRKTFDWKLEFEPELVPLKLDVEWVHDTISQALDCLLKDTLPVAGISASDKKKKCNTCDYFDRLSEQLKS